MTMSEGNAFLTFEPKNVKEMIVFILAHEFPLSTKELKNKIKKYYGRSVSYQGVHKEAMKLGREGLLIKQQKEFMLNSSWVSRFYMFAEALHLNYSKIRKYPLNVLELREDGDIITLDFNSINEVDEYFIDVMDYFYQVLNPKEKIVMHYKHNVWPILHSQKEQEITTKGPKNRKIYCLCGSNTPLDRWCTKYENSIGMNVRIVPGVAQQWGIHIYGDLVIQFHREPKVGQKIDEFFQEHTSINTVDPTELRDMFDLKGIFKVIVHKNKLMADEIKAETLKHFKLKP